MGVDCCQQSLWYLFGHCDVCGDAARFLMDWKCSNGYVPNFRERVVCVRCGLNNRQRFVASYLRQLAWDLASATVVYCAEQLTQFFTACNAVLQGASVVGSEFLSPDLRPGEVVEGVRHEDVTQLSFADETVDIMVTNDVYEHVFDVGVALAEARRVLRDRGTLVFSVPFYPLSDASLQRAKLNRNQILHILPPQHHGNPVGGESLVVREFGWDLLDVCRGAGFRDAYMLAYYSSFYGYLGDGLQYVFVAEC